MIKSLSLTNFRKHSELDLKFDHDGQLILIAGNNGVGKTSILEAITFALYGEGRHGRKNLDSLVKRGSEIEGMSVEMTFTLGQDLYRVHRRRDGRNTTAVLYVNDSPLVEGALGVTAEVTSLLGMDSQGFKLAVVAQQKDLDGLSSLRPAERAQMITRLLRLDILTKAKEEATANFRKEREIFKELQTLSSLDLPEKDFQFLKIQHDNSKIELDNSSHNLQALKAKYVELEPVNTFWVKMEVERKLAHDLNDTLTGELATIQTAIKNLVVPGPLPTPAQDIIDLSTQIVKIENQISAAELFQKEVEQARIVNNDIAAINKKIASKEFSLAAIEICQGNYEPNLLMIKNQLSQKSTALAAAQKDMTLLAQAKLLLEEKLLKNQANIGQCEHCGQIVSPLHQANVNQELKTSLKENTLKLKQAENTLNLLTNESEILTKEEQALALKISNCKLATITKENLQEQIKELNLRVKTLAQQVKNSTQPQTLNSLEELYEEKTNLATMASKLQRNIDYTHKREQLLNEKLHLQTQEISLQEKLMAAKETLKDKEPSPELIANYQSFQELSNLIEEEGKLHTYWTSELAKLQEQLSQIESAQAKAKIRTLARDQHQTNALNNANAATLLLDVSEKLSQEIRPLLEANVSNLLTVMSNGRFTSVLLSEEYEISVLDDEKYRSLADLSGGEIDLVALSLRLALAEVVSARHGSGGAGFLILDECFASQDQERRSTILSALRNLKTNYHQIFLVSHVENMEDYVDQVISISLNADRSETEVLCS